MIKPHPPALRLDSREAKYSNTRDLNIFGLDIRILALNIRIFMKTLAVYLGIAYLVIAFAFTIYDGIQRHGFLGIMSGERSMADMGDAYRNLLWPARLTR